MSAIPTAPASGLPLWIPQLARGIAAVVLGLTITLTLDHSPRFGLLAFGVFAVLTGAITLVGALRSPDGALPRRTFAMAGGVTVLSGVLALALPDGGISTLAILVAGWAILAGALELAAGIRDRRRSPAARDWILTGLATVVLGIVFLAVPRDLVEPFAGERGVSGVLTAAVVLVGALGAWGVLTGVLQVISAVSLRAPRGGDS